jgi:hypothetical protein
MNRQKLVRADTKAAVAELAGDGAQISDVVFQTIDENKIIAAAMHLGKRNFHLTRSLQAAEKDS